MNLQSLENSAPPVKPNTSSDGIIDGEILPENLPPITPLDDNSDITDFFS